MKQRSNIPTDRQSREKKARRDEFRYVTEVAMASHSGAQRRPILYHVVSPGGRLELSSTANTTRCDSEQTHPIA